MIIDEKQLRKTRCRSTANTILNNLDGIEIEDIISTTYVKLDNDLFNLLKHYEKQLILAKINPEEFRTGLNQFYIKLAKEIKKNNLYYKFNRLFYEIFRTSNNSQNQKITVSYINLVGEQYTYLCKLDEYIMGCGSDGKPILVKDKYPYIDAIIDENDVIKSVKALKKNGIEVYSIEDISNILVQDNLLGNAIRMSSFLIDEDYIEMTMLNPIMFSTMPTLKIYNNLEQIKSYLNKRNNFLPSKGICYSIENEVFNEIVLKEKFIDDNLYLLYKLKDSMGQELSGYYDFTNEFFFSPFTYNESLNAIKSDIAIKELVFEVYLLETSDLDISNTRFSNINKTLIHTGKRDIDYLKKHIRYFNKELYNKQIVPVDSYIRKLPAGATASIDAINTAKKYGIVLKPNETFVKSFDKIVYKK